MGAGSGWGTGGGSGGRGSGTGTSPTRVIVSLLAGGYERGIPETETAHRPAQADRVDARQSTAHGAPPHGALPRNRPFGCFPGTCRRGHGASPDDHGRPV